MITPRNRKWLGLVPMVILILVIYSPQEALATDIRGRIDGQHAYSPYPFPVSGARIDLLRWTGGNWVPLYTTFSGPDGMYYIRNIPPGAFYLQVNGMNHYSVTVFDMPLQDIPAILIRY